MIKSLFPAPLTAAHQKHSVGFNRFFGEDIAAKVRVKAVRMYPCFFYLSSNVYAKSAGRQIRCAEHWQKPKFPPEANSHEPTLG